MSDIDRLAPPPDWSAWRHVDLDGYEASFLTDTNSTVSGILGPGRTADVLLQRAGRRLEEAIIRGKEFQALRRRERDTREFVLALEARDLAKMKKLAKYADVTRFEVEALQLAAFKGDLPLVCVLVDKGVNINVKDGEYGWTPLYLAAQSGHEFVVRLLLDQDADVNIANNNGSTPLYLAAQSGHKSVVRLLLDQDADVNIANNNGSTPLHVAAQSGHESVVRLLLDQGADVNIAERDGWAPLHIAARNGHESVVRLLLDQGADVNIANNNGSTPLHVAAQNGHESVVKLLLDQGADVKITNNDGWAPLYIAAQKDHEPIVKLSLDRGHPMQ